MAAFTKTFSSKSHQQNINDIIRRMVLEDNLNIISLNMDRFVNGRYCRYKYFYSDLKLVNNWIIFHNNWLFGFKTKRYKLKEYKMWMVNTNKYYSSPTGRYLTYSNPIDFGMSQTVYEEETALKNAFFLGLLLDRTVILPKFHCYIPLINRTTETRSGEFHTKDCNYMGNYIIKSLDENMEYRENLFLESPLVPIKVKLSRTSQILIDNYTSEFSHYKRNFSTAPIRISMKRPPKGFLEINDLLNNLDKYSNFRVLTFHSLYGNLIPYGEEQFNYHVRKVERAVKSLKKPWHCDVCNSCEFLCNENKMHMQNRQQVYKN